MSSNVRKTGFPWEKHAVKTRIWYAGEGRKSRHGRKGRIMQSRGSWSPCLLMGRRFFHKTLPGLPIYPVLPAGFIRDIKEALLFSSMTRSCVASVAVSPYNLSRNQNHCPGVCFHVYFPRLVARKIHMESEALMPVTKRFWFTFDYRESAVTILFLRRILISDLRYIKKNLKKRLKAPQAILFDLISTMLLPEHFICKTVST